MKQKVLLYTAFLIWIALLMLFVRVAKYDSFTGFSIESLPPEQDVQGYGEDFSLSLEGADINDGYATIRYRLTDFTGDSQTVFVDLDLSDNSETFVSKTVELVIPAGKASDYATSLVIPGNKYPLYVHASVKSGSSFREITLPLAPSKTLVTGNTIGSQQARSVLVFVIFICLLIVGFFFARRKHLNSKKEKIAAMHNSRFIPIHH